MTPQYYIVNALGFALQLLPAMYIVVRPFGAGRYRMPRRKLMVALAVYGLLASAAFPPLVASLAGANDTVLLANVYMLVAAIVFAAFYFYVVGDAPIRKVLSLVLGVVYAAVQYSVVNLLLPFTPPADDLLRGAPYSLWGMVLYAATTVVMLPLMVLFQERALRRYLEVIDVRQTRRDMAAIVVAFAIYLCLSVSYASVFQNQGADINWMTTPVGLLLSALFSLFLYYQYHLALVREQELSNRIHSEVLVESGRLLQREIDRSRDIRHDLRHLLRELSALPDAQGSPEVRRCIGRIEELTRHADTVFCDNRALNALLRYYAGCADENGIPIQVRVACGALDVDDADLVLLVGNVLENALAATSEYYETAESAGEDRDAERARPVKVIGEAAHHNFMLQVVNPCGRIELADAYRERGAGSFLPAEAYRSTHEAGGRGLRRVSQLAELYDGSAEFCYDAGTRTFTSRVVISERQLDAGTGWKPWGADAECE